MTSINVRRVFQLPGIAHLAVSSRCEGFRFIERLIVDFGSGETRFDRPHEALFAAFDGDVCVGIGGVTRDPGGNNRIGRVRRLYVAPTHRGLGVGRALMSHIEAWCSGRFDALQLFTDTAEASVFYESMGYRRVGQNHVSHAKPLVTKQQHPDGAARRI